MKKKYLFTVLATAIMLSFAGCDKKSNSDNNNQANEQAATTDKASEDDNNGDEDNTEDIIINPLEIDGFNYYLEPKYCSTYNDVYVRAMLTKDSTASSYVSDMQLLSKNGDEYVVYYCNSANGEYNKEYEYYEKVNTYYVASVDGKSDSITKKLTFDCDNTFSLKVYGDKFLVQYYEGDNTIVELYDMELNQIQKLSIDNQNGIYPDWALKHIYYYIDNKMMDLDVESNSTSEITFQRKYQSFYVSGVVTDSDGNNHLLLNVCAEDERYYYAVINPNDGQEEKLISNNKGDIIGVNYDAIVYHIISGIDTRNMVIKDDGSAYTYIEPIECYSSYYILSDGKVLCLKIDGYKMQAFLFDEDKLVASTSFEIEVPDNVKNSAGYTEAEGGISGMYMLYDPMLLDDETILFSCHDMMENMYYVQWAYDGVNEDGNYSIEPFDISTVENDVLSAKIDSSKYVPGELSSNLSDLRKKADQMEENYGIEILIGQPCRNIIGGYAIKDLTNPMLIESALNELELELEKYPYNFFEQFYTKYNQGIVIYISDYLQGLDNQSLDYAGGFQTTYEDKYLIVMDSSYRGNIENTFHHELAHTIDYFIWDRYYENNWDDNGYCLNDNKWEALNPVPEGTDTVYTRDYSVFGYEDYMMYTYTEGGLDGNNDNIYFIDGYAMTFPTEDRARLWEEIMSSTKGVDFEQYPHLKGKIEYYSQCIRQTFDTTGWNNVYWENFER